MCTYWPLVCCPLRRLRCSLRFNCWRSNGPGQGGLTLKSETVRSFETPLNIYRSTHREMPDYLNIHTESSFFSAHYRHPVWGFVVFWHSKIAELFAVLSKRDRQRRTDLHFMYRYCCCACSNPLQDNLWATSLSESLLSFISPLISFVTLEVWKMCAMYEWMRTLFGSIMFCTGHSRGEEQALDCRSSSVD